LTLEKKYDPQPEWGIWSISATRTGTTKQTNLNSDHNFQKQTNPLIASIPLFKPTSSHLAAMKRQISSRRLALVSALAALFITSGSVSAQTLEDGKYRSHLNINRFSR
jgi:hypothetical protein